MYGFVRVSVIDKTIEYSLCSNVMSIPIYLFKDK